MDETLRQLGELLLGAVPTVILLALLYVLYTLIVHKPLRRVLAERRSKTEGAVEKSRADIAAAEARTSEYEQRLREARATLFRAQEARRKGACGRDHPAGASAGWSGTMMPHIPQGPAAKKMNSVKKIIRIFLLALLVVGFAGPIRSMAQEPAATPQKKQAEPAPKRRGPAQELVHETREAAGEEKDETAEFKQSASVQAIARLTGLSVNHAFLLSDWLNFAVIAALIVWAGRKFLPGMFSARTAAIQKAMQEAQKASDEARRRLAEIESRLMKLDVEIGMMRDAAEKDAAAEEARIQAAAEEEARKMVESAQQEIAAAIKTARRDLTTYAADLAVGLAQKQIRVDAATDQKLVRNFAGELGASEAAGPGKGRG